VGEAHGVRIEILSSRQRQLNSGVADATQSLIAALPGVSHRATVNRRYAAKKKFFNP
jgi:hypothetical protein